MKTVTLERSTVVGFLLMGGTALVLLLLAGMTIEELSNRLDKRTALMKRYKEDAARGCVQLPLPEGH